MEAHQDKPAPSTTLVFDSRSDAERMIDLLWQKNLEGIEYDLGQGNCLVVHLGHGVEQRLRETGISFRILKD